MTLDNPFGYWFEFIITYLDQTGTLITLSNFIVFSKAKRLKEINISLASYSIKQHGTLEYLGCQLDSKLSGEALASKIVGKVNGKLNFLYRRNLSKIPNSCVQKTIMQRANSTTFRLRMFFMVSSFKEKFKNQTSKSSKQIYSFCHNLSPRSPVDPSHFRGNKMMSSQGQSRALYRQYRF